MNFFEHQQRARQRTTLLALLFVLATLTTVLLTDAVALIVVAVYTAGDDPRVLSLSQWIGAHPRALVWTSLGTLGVIGAASMYRMASLSAGGSAVARAVGGTLVDADSADPQKRQLLNLVEEMAIAAGVPAPQVYVLEQEPGINAFAAGFSTSDAAIAVTRGTLELLTRDELQGVVAHEFSHILNGDMRLNTHLLGVVYGLLFIGLTGRLILRGLSRVRGSSSSRVGGSSSSGRGGWQLVAAVFIAALALMVIGYIGTLLATMIRAAVSRQREFLADASAVQFTRNPAGIAGALKKIAVSPLRSVLQNADGEEISHMLLADGRKMFQAFFATHPPIVERIKAIDAHFQPSELEHIKLTPVNTGPRAPVAKTAATLPISPALVIAAIGNPGGQLEAVERSQAAIPKELRRVARSRVHAPSLALALALNKDASERGRQIGRLQQRLPGELFPHLQAVVAMVDRVAPELRLSLIDMAFPALRLRPAQELQMLIATIEEIGRMDGRFDVLDYALVRLLRVQLVEALAPQTVRAGMSAKLDALRDQAGVMFAVVAQAGERDKYAAQRAYTAGMQQLLGSNIPAYAPPEPWMGALDRALTRLDGLVPMSKQALIEALVVTVLHDRRVSLGELELLRAICASLHCPVPPLAPVSTESKAENILSPHSAA